MPQPSAASRGVAGVGGQPAVHCGNGHRARHHHHRAGHRGGGCGDGGEESEEEPRKEMGLRDSNANLEAEVRSKWWLEEETVATLRHWLNLTEEQSTTTER